MDKSRETGEWQVQQWDDLAAHVRIRGILGGDLILEYEVRTLIQYEGDWMFEALSENGAGIEATTDVETAIKLIHGNIKWDGCGHHYFGESGYIHSCGGEFDMARIGEIYKRIYAWSKQQHPDWML